MRFAVLAIVAGCSHATPRAFERDIDVDERAGVARRTADVLAAPSIVFLANTPVRAAPSAESARIGIVGRDARAKPVQAAPPGGGCAKRWIEIRPRGWVCEANVAASHDPPTAATPVALDDDAPLEPGRYGAVRAETAWIYDNRADAEANNGHAPEGSMLVRAADVALVGGERYWVTSSGALIGEAAIAPIASSSFRGVAVTGELRVAWTHRRDRPGAPVPLRGAPRPDASLVGEVSARTQVTIAERSPDGRFVRLDAPAGWVARADLRAPSAAPPPPGTGTDERWFDVDLDEQVLVAYEGTRPVYATLVSTGRPDHRTPPALARVAHKLRATTMTSSTADAAYSVGDVPWAMFYQDTFALHGAYWHDGFGDVHSHGCVNLAPRDARVLFAWAAPEVPPGWTAVFAAPGAPGSVVRIHGR